MLTTITHVVIGVLLGTGFGYYAHYRWGTELKADLQKVETAIKK